MLNRFYNALTPSNFLRAYNLLIVGLVLKEYFENPEAAAGEYLGDVAVHFIQAMLDPNKVCPALGISSIVGNSWRLYNIGEHLLAGDSTMPTVGNLVDLLNHGANLAFMGTLFARSKKEDKAEVVEENTASFKKNL